MLDVSRSDLSAGVAGSGTMGRGIVQVLAQCGARVRVFDAQAGAAARAKDSIAKALAGQVQKGRMQQGDADATLSRIDIVDSLEAELSFYAQVLGFEPAGAIPRLEIANLPD